MLRLAGLQALNNFGCRIFIAVYTHLLRKLGTLRNYSTLKSCAVLDNNTTIFWKWSARMPACRFSLMLGQAVCRVYECVVGARDHLIWRGAR